MLVSRGVECFGAVPWPNLAPYQISVSVSRSAGPAQQLRPRGLGHISEKVDARSPDRAKQPAAGVPGDAGMRAGNARGAVAAAGGHMPEPHHAVAANGGQQGAIREKAQASIQLAWP